MAVRAVQPKLKRDGEENIDEKLEKDTIEITAYFEGAETAEAYFGLSSYLQYTRKNYKNVMKLLKKREKKKVHYHINFLGGKLTKLELPL